MSPEWAGGVGRVMYESAIEELLECPPAGVDPSEWETLSEGERLRFLKSAHYVVPLTPKQRAAVERLPSWVGYGPMDGLPREWFNQAGLLLPKFRPGGGRHQDFRRLRRLLRLVRRTEESVVQQWEQLVRRFGPAAQVLWTILVYGTVFFVGDHLWDGRLYPDLLLLVLFVSPILTVLGGYTLPALILRLRLRWALRHVARRLNRTAQLPPTSHGP